ncbi:hypothetical protein crov380 [Cafeteria roenbergensis virus]|uniref:Uncharacterized protein n=1 Tax=Cafeteria roenbergensis virus (strain BV-PW1) TaxID=693272 RepID=E3T5F1_CROVB|nr:hypothetical protein crov380 [Cafeteria roenbergensis virus BV-PW1]ADO67414.1 hypothetical protein crov380 [Cafeteria roenbergensis virus BV-PW1]
MNPDEINVGLKFNEQTFFDKGNENVWMKPVKDNTDKHLLLNKDANKLTTTLPEFEEHLTNLMNTRYYVRRNALK